MKKVISFLVFVLVMCGYSIAHAVTMNIPSNTTKTDYYEIQFDEWRGTDDVLVVSPYRLRGVECGQFTFLEFYDDTATTADLRFLRYDETVISSQNINRNTVYATHGYNFIEVRLQSNGVSTNFKGSLRFYQTFPSDAASGETVTGNLSINGPVDTRTFIDSNDTGLTASQNFSETATTGNFTSTATNLYSLDLINSSSSDLFGILYDALDTTAASAKKVYLIPQQDENVLGLNEFGGSPLYFSTGMTLGISTTDNVSSFAPADPATVQWAVRYK